MSSTIKQVQRNGAGRQAQHQAEEHAGQEAAAVEHQHDPLFVVLGTRSARGLEDQFGFLVKAVGTVVLEPVLADLEQALFLVMQFTDSCRASRPAGAGRSAHRRCSH